MQRAAVIHSIIHFGGAICNVHPPMVYTSTLMEETINITDAFSSNKWNALRGDLWRIQIPAPAAGESIRYNTLFMYLDVKYLRQNYFATIWVNIWVEIGKYSTELILNWAGEFPYLIECNTAVDVISWLHRGTKREEVVEDESGSSKNSLLVVNMRFNRLNEISLQPAQWNLIIIVN